MSPRPLPRSEGSGDGEEPLSVDSSRPLSSVPATPIPVPCGPVTMGKDTGEEEPGLAETPREWPHPQAHSLNLERPWRAQLPQVWSLATALLGGVSGPLRCGAQWKEVRAMGHALGRMPGRRPLFPFSSSWLLQGE